MFPGSWLWDGGWIARCSLGLFLGVSMKGEGRSEIGNKEKLGYDSVPIKALAAHGPVAR
jgi:hypothetical protein